VWNYTGSFASLVKLLETTNHGTQYVGVVFERKCNSFVNNNSDVTRLKSFQKIFMYLRGGPGERVVRFYLGTGGTLG